MREPTPSPEPCLTELAAYLPHPVLVCGPTGAVLYSNPAAATLGAQLALDSVAELLPGDHGRRVRDGLAGGCSGADVEVVVRDRLLLWTYSPARPLERVYLSARDITEQRRAEFHLRLDEARHRLLTEQSTDIISRHTPQDWRFLYASPALTPLLGYSPEEIIGRSSLELIHPDDVESYRRRAPSVVYEQGVYTNTYRIRRKDGRYTWLETTSRVLRDPRTQAPLEIICVSRDVSRRVQSEQATKRLARIVELTTDLVAFAEPGGRITYLNEAARETLGIAHPENADRGLWELFVPESRRLLETEGLPEAAARGVWHGETILTAGDGRRIPVSQVLLAHKSSARVDYYSTIARDMSERRQAEEQAQRHQLEMAHAARLITMGEMASGLAHELNQPLAAIVNYAQGCIRRIDASPPASLEVLRDGLERISRQARRAGEIIRRLRSFVRKGEFRRSPAPINELLLEMIHFCAPEARRHQVEIQTDLQPELPLAAVDRVQIEQVILNLLRNAMEACNGVRDARGRDARGRDARGRNAPCPITVASTDLGERVLVTVSDRGHGLGAEEVEKIFEQFYTTKPKGLGMGLVISRSIIEAHGGRLWAEPNPGGGARFSFTLPACLTH